MSIAAKNRTWAGLAAQRPEPRRKFTQAQKRERRHQQLSVTYTGSFSLTDEISAICRPLATRVAAQPRPEGWWRRVDPVRDAAHSVASCVVGMLAEANAQRSTRGLDVALRNVSARGARDLAQRPTLPEITDEQLVDGTWAQALVAMVEPLDAPLAALLKNATTRVNDRLIQVLHELDAADVDLRKLLDKADARPLEGSTS